MTKDNGRFTDNFIGKVTKPAAVADDAGGTEMFTLVDGKKVDANLHAPILAPGKADMKAIRARAKDLGLPQDAIDRLYPGKA